MKIPFLNPPDIDRGDDDGIPQEEAAPLTPPERSPTQQTRRKAIIWALIFHVVVLLICVFIVALPRESDAPEIIAEVIVPEKRNDLKMQKLSAVKQLKAAQASASASVSKMMRANTSAVVAAPEVKMETSSPLGLGMGDLGAGFGLGSGSGGGGMAMAKIPATMRGRCIPGERTRLLFENGGIGEVEAAVIRSLDWLKEEQNENGSWGDEFYGAMTGFALLCYLGHCETPKSKDYGETVTKGLQYLIEKAKSQGGKIGSLGEGRWAYEHGIASYALGEAHALLKEEGSSVPDLGEVFKKAAKIIVDGQNDDGGWVYGYTRSGGGDLSVTGWQFQALKTAQHARVDVTGLGGALSRTLRFISERQGPKGGFGYRKKEDRHSLTGVGILGLQFLTKGKRSQINKGFEFYLSQGPFDYETFSCDLYSWYYMNQAAFNHGGYIWEEWNGAIRDQLIDAQDDSGRFREEGGGKTRQGGASEEVYRTCLCTLMLEVYYRYLPATG